ncbi:MAG TPA: OmpA family protein [Blastocatellia bacterium]|nr:OmpA family protein [Blastocatellia bacterium]
MIYRLLTTALLLALAVVAETGCATKKYVRNRIAERVEPLENRTGELEETSRRNSQQISELNSQISDVRGKADQALNTADRAAASAEQANTRVAQVEGSVSDLRENIDRYTVQNTSMVFFRPGSTRLTPEAISQLNALAQQIGTQRGFVLEIVGFGDTSRATRYNENLAELRAQAVERYLADKQNIPVMRMYAIGFGEPGAMGGAAAPVSTATVGGGTYNEAEIRRSVRIRVLTNDAVTRIQQRSRTASGNR